MTSTVIRADRAVVEGEERRARSPCGRPDRRRPALDVTAARGRSSSCDDEVLLPGIVDTHVHVNEPGRTEWEGFRSATRAAAAGGVTTIVDMPLNSHPADDDRGALRGQAERCAERSSSTWGSGAGPCPATSATCARSHDGGRVRFQVLPDRLRRRGVPAARPGGLRCRDDRDGAARGVDDRACRGRGPIDERLAAGRSVLRGLPVLAAAGRGGRGDRAGDRAARVSGSRTHLLHLSSADARAAARAARAAGVPLTRRDLPALPVLDAEDVPDGATEFKCCPPIREAENRTRLWEALGRGDIDIDRLRPLAVHAGAQAARRRRLRAGVGRDRVRAARPAGGLDRSARARALDSREVVRWMATGPADQVGLPHKGRIAVGADADLLCSPPTTSSWSTSRRLQHKNPISAYAGRTLTGVVRQTWLRGAPRRHRRSASRPTPDERTTMSTLLRAAPAGCRRRRS